MFATSPQKMKLLAFLILIFTVEAVAQTPGMAASDIIEKSIAYSGGKEALSKISSLEQLYLHLDEAGNSASIAEKRKDNKYLTQSIISLGNESQTTFFNGAEIVYVRGGTVKRFSGAGRHELMLKTFSHLTLAYATLNHAFTRLPDAKAENTDCYVVEAKNPDGYATVNYFDKTSFRQVMVLYPGGTKSFFSEDVEQNGIRFNKHIINTDAAGKVSQMVLVDIKVNTAISHLWFDPPFQSTFAVPDGIRYGTFQSVATGTVIRREATRQVNGSGESATTFQADWKNQAMFEIRQPGQLPGEGFIVRIVSWDGRGYVCHVMGLAGAGTDEFRKI
jgi:hypothetical protein